MDPKVFAIFAAVFVGYMLFVYRKPTRSVGYVIMKLKQNLAKLDPAYAELNIQESTKESYTIDKVDIHLCTHDPITKQPYSTNTLMYVTLHEIAHTITPESDSEKDEHGPIFKKNFNDLLMKAAQKKLYNPKRPIPSTYCGLHQH